MEKGKIDRVQRRYDYAKSVLKPFFIPLSRSLKITGSKNIIEGGPNLIVANHPGIGRDVASVVLSYRRRLHFLAAHYLFDEEQFLQEHIRPALGEPLFRVLYPIARQFASFLVRQMHDFEMIPINREYHGDRRKLVANLREALEKVKQYLLLERAVVIFPLRYNLIDAISLKIITRRRPSKFNPAIQQIGSTVAKIVYELWHTNRLDVPVTPIAIASAEGLNPLREIRVNIGKPLRIGESLDRQPVSNPIVFFTEILERALGELLVDNAS
jgi:1-acyl-sn-glycerol-3-phosphate acyltransferase